MIDERDEREGARSLLVFLAGGLIGAGISLLYAPLSGEKTRQYLRIQTKKAEGIELTKEKKAELLTAIEAGKKAMEEERKRIEEHHSE
jgi:gas vesicle protein